MRLMLRRVHDPLARFRLLWLAVAWLLTGVLSILGAAYCFGGRHVLVTGRAFVVLLRWMPFGIRGHGVVLLTLGLLLGWCLLAPSYRRPLPWTATRRVLMAVGAYLLWSVWSFGAAPLAGGALSLTAVVTWTGFMILPFALVTFPPPETHDAVRSGRA